MKEHFDKCPFCNTNEVQGLDISEEDRLQVLGYCFVCGATIDPPTQKNKKQALAAAARAWNRRTPMPVYRNAKNGIIPCPFCGHEEIVKVTGYELDGTKTYAWYECKLSRGGCGATSVACENEDHALEAWNRRDGVEEFIYE